MDLRQLRYVVEVARLGGFTRAAESLHVAQPALSLAVRQLEAELRIRLFDRTSRRVSQTDAGVAFIARATRILGEVDGVVEEMAEFAGAIRGTVRASIFYHLDPALPALLRDFIVDNPGIRFSIVELAQPVAIAELLAGTLDFGIFGLTATADLVGLETVTMREESLVLAVHPGHPLARERSISIARLAEVPLIVGSSGLLIRKMIDAMLAEVAVIPEVVLETTSVEAGVAYASLGIGGLVLMPSMIASVNRPVSIVEIDGAPIFRTGLVWNPTAHRRPAAALALEYVRAAVEREQAHGPRAGISA